MWAPRNLKICIKPQARIALSVAALTLSTICAAHLLVPGPTYRGKTVGVWLEGWSFTPRPSPRAVTPTEWVANRKAIREAIRAMGPAAVPPLLSMLRARDSSLKLRFVKTRAFKWLVSQKILHDFEADSVRNCSAADALGLLGPSASTAVPELIKMFEQDSFVPRRCAAADALGAIGCAASNAVPGLT